MKNRILIAIVVLALAALACSVATPGGSNVQTDPPSNEVAPTSVSGGNGLSDGNNNSNNNGGNVNPFSDRPLLKDDFKGRDSNWGTGTDSDSSVEYVNDALQFVVFTPNYFVYSTPNDDRYENIHVEVTALNTSTDSNAAFGIMCNQQVTDAAYYAYITPAGDYGIVKTAVARDDEDLVTGSSDLIPANASSYQIGFDCTNGTLTLYVNGQKIDSAADSDYTAGNVALFAWSDEVASGVNVAFDDFVVSSLK